MEYQKIINLLDNTANQPTKFWTNNWVKTNHEEHGTNNTNGQIKFKTSMVSSSLCYSDEYILVRGTITAIEMHSGRGNNGIEVVFKNCALIYKWNKQYRNR